MSLKIHALHHTCIITIFSCILDVCYICWAHDIFKFARYMLMHFHVDIPSIYFYLYWLYLSCIMVPKWKSTLSQNPLRSGASTSSSFDPTPSSIQFHDGKARKDFSENFCRIGIHLEHHVVLSDFSDTDLPTVIHSKGWESLRDIAVTCSSMIIQEFYSNMHEIILQYLISSLAFEVRAL